MGLSLILDIVLVGLLVVFISYAVVLNRRLQLMRRDNAEFKRLAQTFSNATARADESVRKLKGTADELRGRIDKAQSLRDDLAFLIERGGTAADRLEAVVREARKDAPPNPPLAEGRRKKSSKGEDKEANSEAERELMRALQTAREGGG